MKAIEYKTGSILPVEYFSNTGNIEMKIQISLKNNMNKNV